MEPYQPPFNKEIHMQVADSGITNQTALQNEKLHVQQIYEMIIEVHERERNNLGRELHDNAGQLLLTAKLYMDILPVEREEDIKIWQKALEFIQASIDEIRKISRQLMVPQLKQEDLVVSIKDMIKEMNLRKQLNVLFHYDKEIENISYFEKITFYKIVEEQLQHIIAHSKAKQVIINLECQQQQVQLIICDDGAGFDTRSAQKEIALMNILERVRIYSGLVEIHSAPGHGCQLIVTLPAK